MTSAGSGGGGGGGGSGGGGGDPQRMLKLESGGQCVGGAESGNQFCHVLNQMYGNNYQYYDGSDYLTAYRQSQAHKQHYIQVSQDMTLLLSSLYLSPVLPPVRANL